MSEYRGCASSAKKITHIGSRLEAFRAPRRSLLQAVGDLELRRSLLELELEFRVVTHAVVDLHPQERIAAFLEQSPGDPRRLLHRRDELQHARLTAGGIRRIDSVVDVVRIGHGERSRDAFYGGQTTNARTSLRCGGCVAIFLSRHAPAAMRRGARRDVRGELAAYALLQLAFFRVCSAFFGFPAFFFRLERAI